MSLSTAAGPYGENMRKRKDIPSGRFAGIRYLYTDCDGVLTDAKVYVGPNGEEWKRFSIRDGMGVERLRTLAGVDVGIISGEKSRALAERASKLRITRLHLGVRDKLEILERTARAEGLSLSAFAFIGDDVNDLPLMAAVGFSACPSNAVPKVLAAAEYVCRKAGGEDAFREVCELIIRDKEGGPSA
jgi:3-deoxy-D-manno-octulosonate 8-phosphate phosphatase (KDO 8-P phosphatase)